jgi:hypothetical protein
VLSVILTSEERGGATLFILGRGKVKDVRVGLWRGVEKCGRFQVDFVWEISWSSI